jgi:hypothetical protein
MTMMTFDGVIDARAREVKAPTVARYIPVPGEVRYVVIGTKYGCLRDIHGSVRTWRSYSGAQHAAKRWLEMWGEMA